MCHTIILYFISYKWAFGESNPDATVMPDCMVILANRHA